MIRTPDSSPLNNSPVSKEREAAPIQVPSGDGDFLYHYVRATMPRALRQYMGASDIVQSVLMRVNNGLKHFRGDNQGQFRSWVIQIARHRILDGIRRYRLGLLHREVSGQVCVGGSSLRMEDRFDPLDHLALEEQVANVLAAISALPEDVRQIVVLRYSHELTFIEIAERMKLPVTTCRRRWLEGCESLRVQLQSIL